MSSAKSPRSPKSPGAIGQSALDRLTSPWALGTFVLPAGSCLLYCAASMTMTYSNKMVLSVYNFSLPLTLLLFQNVCAVVLVVVAKQFGLVQYADFNMQTAKRWFPITFLFMAMLFTGFGSLKHLTVPMFTIFKNLNNIVITVGDKVMFGFEISAGVTFSLSLMVLSAIIAGVSDLSFNTAGYVWMFFNCAATASYVLFLRFSMKDMKLGEFGMAFYNNLLSIPMLLLFILVSGEMDSYEQDLYPKFDEEGFLMWAVTSGVVGFILSISSFFCVRLTSPTTYSIVGSLNKIPLAIFSIIIFRTPVNTTNAMGICLGLTAGVVYAFTKYLQAKKKAAQTADSKA